MKTILIVSTLQNHKEILLVSNETPYIQLRRHTSESHFGWIRVGSRAYTLHCGWQSRPHWVGEHRHTCPWWCSANLQTCTCPAGRPQRSGPRESNAGRRHMSYHCLVQCSCQGTGDDSTCPYPCMPSSHTPLDTLEKKNTNIEKNISCCFKRRVSFNIQGQLCKSTEHVLRMNMFFPRLKTVAFECYYM